MSVRISAKNSVLLYLKQNWRCNYCWVSFNLYILPTVDHIIPRVDPRSTNNISNFCLACEKCNKQKWDLSVLEFIKKLW